MLKDFLDAKPLYYDEIDYTRMPRVYASVKKYFKIPKVIHLVGTNGKGTTGRFLASALNSIGYEVGHYTSPHIVEFNERIWINGKNVSNEQLELAHKQLLSILSKGDRESLSYFEYTTLLAMILFQDLEYVVLEAGLGGEHDATAVFDKVLTLVTPIDLDHQAFLGETIKDISTTKLKAIQNKAILAKQIHIEVHEVLWRLAKEKSLEFYHLEELLCENDMLNIKIISEKLSLVSYLIENLKLSIAALKVLGIDYNTEDFIGSQFFGRLTPYKENILLDVGHNPLAASSIVKTLKENKYILIYNSYKDKDYYQILQILKPIVEHVEILSIKNNRVENQAVLQETLRVLEIEYKDFNEVLDTKNYLVFGSFSVVENFLEVYNG